MKSSTIVSLALTLFASSLALAQSGSMGSMDMKDMDMKDMDIQKCQEMMNNKNMKGMDMQKCHDMMNNQDMKGMDHGKGDADKSAKAMTRHKASGVVKSVDPDKGTVSISHGPVKSMDWPAMTMRFSVKDKALLDKLAVDKKVQVEFVKQGPDYVITSVK